MPPLQQVPWTECTYERCVHLLDLYHHVLCSFNLIYNINLALFNNFNSTRLEGWSSSITSGCLSIQKHAMLGIFSHLPLYASLHMSANALL